MATMLDHVDSSSESDGRVEVTEMIEVKGESDPAATTETHPKSKDPPNAAVMARDPLRPKRKKARRACHACQRAHLTCGMCTNSSRQYIVITLNRRISARFAEVRNDCEQI